MKKLFSVFVFLLVIPAWGFNKFPTPTPRLTDTPTATFTPTPTLTPIFTFTPTKTFTPTPTATITNTVTQIPTPYLAVYALKADGTLDTTAPTQSSHMWLFGGFPNNENYLRSDGYNAATTCQFGMATCGILHLFGYVDNNQTEVALSQGGLKIGINQDSTDFFFNNGNLDFNGTFLERVSYESFQASNGLTGTVTLSAGAAAVTTTALPAIVGTPVCSAQLINKNSGTPTYILTSCATSIITFGGTNTDTGIYKWRVWGQN